MEPTEHEDLQMVEFPELTVVDDLDVLEVGPSLEWVKVGLLAAIAVELAVLLARGRG